MPVTITVEDNEVRSMVQRMSDIPKMTIQWLRETAAPRMRSSFEENFKSEGRPKWQALKSSTEKRRMYGRRAGLWDVGDSHPILQRTGDLMRMVISTEEKVEVGGDEITMLMDPDSMVGSFPHRPQGGARSFKYHQTGTSRIPQRQIISFQDEDVRWLNNRYEDFLEKIVHGV